MGRRERKLGVGSPMTSRRKQPAPRERRSPAGAKNSRPEPRTKRHPLYGDIPLVEVIRRDTDGREIRWFDFDRSYRPALPKGAVLGDLDQQHFCPMCHLPRFFYLDQTRQCAECGRDFVFSGKEQKFWYEELKFHFDSVAIRCLDCRRRQRTRNGLNSALSRAKRRVAEEPLNPICQLKLAEALVRLYEHTGHGDLTEAIAAARKASRSPGRTESHRGEALFWEAMAQANLGREERARPLFAEARRALPPNPRGATLRAEAEWALSRPSSDSR